MIKKDTHITSIGYMSLQETIKKLERDYKEYLDEMNEVKNNCLSTDDTSELSHYRMMIDSIGEKLEKHRDLLESSIVVDVDSLGTSIVRFGSLVTLENLDTEETVTYRLVSAYESDPKNGMISIASPLGRELSGCLPGDVVDLITPSGHIEYEIIEIGK